MPSISTWILSIAGVICLSVLIELIMPNGQMNKYIKNIFSFVIVLVIIMPIPKLIGKQFDSSSIFNQEEIVLQEDYLYSLNISKLTAIKENIENDIILAGYDGVEVSISADIFVENIVFKTVYVNLSDLVITEEAEHKDIVEIKEEIEISVGKFINNVEVVFEG